MSTLSIQSEYTTTFKWEVSNFSTVAARNDPKKRLNSDDFKLDFSAIKFYLQFQPTTRQKDGNKNYSSFYLSVQNFAGESSIKLCYRFWIENQLGEKISETKGSFF
jgi:hypothetical protein